MRLSIAIPIYNFADFIVETLDSIVAQDGAAEVEIVVVDGASTDATPQVMADYQARHANVRYERLPAKGGIDRDMATAFALTQGEYCWLFSGDDIMRPGALRRAASSIQTDWMCEPSDMELSGSVSRTISGNSSYIAFATPVNRLRIACTRSRRE